MKFKNLIFTFSIIIFLFSCSGNGKTSEGLLPPASGSPGEMIVVMDSAQWKNVLGREVRETFAAEVSGLPREEKMFKINQVDPQKLNSLLKQVRNLLFVVTMDDKSSASRRIRSYFTQETLQRIRENDDLFVYTAENEFSKGQQVMYLFGNSEEQLIKHIRENRGALQDFFNNAEFSRLENTVFKGKKMSGLTDILEKEHECTMTLPVGYQLVVSEANGQRGFVWFRQMNDDNDKNIFITYRPYISEQLFTKENLINLRDSIAQEQLFGDPDLPNTTYMLTETTVPYIPVTATQETFNDKYAMELRGLWRTFNKSMGGPFLGYAMVDESLNRFYYIEGFVYSPGKDQREYIREMDVVLHTFNTLGEQSGNGDTPPEAE